MKNFFCLLTLLCLFAGYAFSATEPAAQERSPLATCYDSLASARPGDSMIQKLNLEMISRKGKPVILAGKGIQMLQMESNSNYPVLFTVGGPFREAQMAPGILSYRFAANQGWIKYIEYAQAPYHVVNLTLDYDANTVSITITDGHVTGTLTAMGCTLAR